MPARELGANHIPGQLEQLHTRHRVCLGCLKVCLKLLGEKLILHDRDIRRHLEYAPTAQVTQLVDKLSIVLGAPVEGRVHHPPVKTHIAVRPALTGVDLAVYHAGNGALDRGHFSECLSHGRNLGRTGCMGNLATQAEQQAHLRPIPHVGLMIAKAVARSLEVDVPR